MTNNIEYVELHERLKESYMSYAMATIVDRALPDVRDGLLPVHRRTLYAMFNAGITYDKPYSKSSEPVSETMKIHNHGDGSIYSSLALLTDRNESLLHPLIDGDGSFGKVYSSGNPAHMRYTFCRLNKFSEEMFQNISKDTVKIIDDGEHIQPTVLPTTFPMILIKPNKAIAVGMACTFGSFNLNDVCDYTTAYMDDNSINPIDYLIPDFSTGGYLLYDENKLKNILNNGKGGLRLRAKYEYNKNTNCIVIKEIPYSTNIQTIIKEITDKMGTKLKEVKDVRDSTGFNKIKEVEEMGITIELKRYTDVDIITKKLFKETSLECTFSFNMNCLVNNQPQVLGVNKILDQWLQFRRGCIVKAMKYDLNKLQKKLHLLLGLEKILLNIDKTVEIIRFDANPKLTLMSYFSIDETQVDHILDIRLEKINEKHIISQIKEIENLKQETLELETNVENPIYIDNKIKEDLERVKKKYGKPRQTEIIYEDILQEISNNALIEEYNCNLILSSEGYIKKHLKQSDNHRLKDSDSIIQYTTSTNKSDILLFSNKQNRYKIPCYELNTYAPSQYGDYIPNLVKLDDGEEIIAMASIEKPIGYIVCVYEDGKISKIDINSYLSNNKKLANCYSNKSKLMTIKYIKDDVNILLISSEGKALIVNTDRINPKSSRNSQGNVGMKLDNHAIVGCIIDVNEDINFELETEKGKLKEFMLNDIAPTGRNNEERAIFSYILGRCGNGGSFLINTRSNNDKIINFKQL